MNTMDQDYDSYQLNPLDITRIQPLLKQIELNDLSFKFFVSSVYWTPTSYGVVQKHNKEIRRTLRKFFKENIRMWFFIEKHLDPSTPSFGGFSRHILLEDPSAVCWSVPQGRLRNFLLDQPETFFATSLGDGITDQQKMEVLKRVIRLLPFIPNGKSGLDIRSIHNLEKLVAYVSKQFEKVLPSYEILDPASSDIDPTFLIHYEQDGTTWKTRPEKISGGTYRPLSPSSFKQRQSKATLV